MHYSHLQAVQMQQLSVMTTLCQLDGLLSTLKLMSQNVETVDIGRLFITM